MPKKSKDELLAQVRELIGDNTTDGALELIEDITDTFDEPAEDWKKKYEETDAAWRKRYRDRFYSGDVTQGDGGTDETVLDSGETEVKNMTYDELFKEG